MSIQFFVMQAHFCERVFRADSMVEVILRNNDWDLGGVSGAL